MSNHTHVPITWSGYIKRGIAIGLVATIIVGIGYLHVGSQAAHWERYAAQHEQQISSLSELFITHPELRLFADLSKLAEDNYVIRQALKR